MKKTRKLASMLLALTLTFSGAINASATSTVIAEETGMQVNNVIIEPFASDVLSSWTPSASTSKFSAIITLVSTYSGTAYLELQKKDASGSWGYVDSTSKSFSVKAFSISKDKSISSGTYRLVLTLTVNGTNTTRTSPEIKV